MDDYLWQPKGMKVNIEAIAVEPLLAFKLFDLPALNNPGWIKEDKPVSAFC